MYRNKLLCFDWVTAVYDNNWMIIFFVRYHTTMTLQYSDLAIKILIAPMHYLNFEH